MIRKHIALLLAIFSFSTSAAFLQDQSVQAAKWHHGTPTALRGHWRTNVFWQYGFRNYNTMAIGKHELISTIHAIGSTADVNLVTKVHISWSSPVQIQRNGTWRFQNPLLDKMEKSSLINSENAKKWIARTLLPLICSEERKNSIEIY